MSFSEKSWSALAVWNHLSASVTNQSLGPTADGRNGYTASSKLALLWDADLFDSSSACVAYDICSWRFTSICCFQAYPRHRAAYLHGEGPSTHPG